MPSKSQFITAALAVAMVAVLNRTSFGKTIIG